MLIIGIGFSYSADHKEYVDFYFTKLKTEAEKLWFTEHFMDEEVKYTLNSLANYFCKNEYKSSFLLELAKLSQISNRDIIRWHKSFLFHEAEEYKIYGNDIYFKELLKNNSFKYLVSLHDEKELDKLYMYLSSMPPKNFDRLTSEEKVSWEEKKKRYELYLKHGDTK